MNDLDKIKEYLLHDDISIVEDQIFAIIPELKYKINVMVKIIELHSSKIEIQDINKYNIDFYRRLLKIQKCDAKGYEKEHAMQIYQQLENTEMKLKKIY